MEIYSVVAVVEGFDLDSEAHLAGLDCLSYPAISGRTGGIVSVDAEVPGDSAAAALVQLASDLRQIGAQVVRFDADLVSISDIAFRLDVSRETVRLWSQGKRRAGFPPAFTVAGETMLWRWSDVQGWVTAQGLQMDELPSIPADVVDAYNGALAQARATRDPGWFAAVKRPQRPIVHLDQKRQSRPVTQWVTPTSTTKKVG